MVNYPQASEKELMFQREEIRDYPNLDPTHGAEHGSARDHCARDAFRPWCTRVDPVPMSSPATSFTPKQGQYLAFIYAYTRVLGRPPAEADLQKHFGVSPPSVHQMVLTLERAGLIRRQPGVARSIEALVPPELLPILR